MFNFKKKIYSAKEFFIVLSCILLSKSLYYESYGNNLLLGALLLFLICSYKPTAIKINNVVLLYTLFFIMLLMLNPESNYRSLLVLLIRISIVVYVVHILKFYRFSIIYTKIILFLTVISIFSLLVIYFNIPSPFPSFQGLDERVLRNFIFFGVSDYFIVHGIYRNSGLWWEPGAFQLFINIAFIFSIVNKTINKKIYLVFMLGIISTVSTTGIIVFVLLTLICCMKIIRKSRNKLLSFLMFFILFSLVLAFLSPLILNKFYGESSTGLGLSFLSRYYDFVISFSMLADNILIGYGYGSQIQNAIPYGSELMGSAKYTIIAPTGADGLTMFLAQMGVFSVILLIPLIFPIYYQKEDLFSKSIISLSIVILFNTENFTFILIFLLLSLYGIVGTKKNRLLITNHSFREHALSRYYVTYKN